MKYQQPYGVSDPNASYVNGNPAAGTAGSIPPAAAIEHAQRELVHFIQWVLTDPADRGALNNGIPFKIGTTIPSAGDLQQLRKALTLMFPSLLPLNAEVFVRPGGNNDNDGQSNDDAHAFADMVGVINYAQRFTGANRLKVTVAPGTYPSWRVDNLPVGLDIVGDTSTDNVVFDTSSVGVNRGCIEVLRGSDISLTKIAYGSTSPGSYGLVAANASRVLTNGLWLRGAPRADIIAQSNSAITLGGAISVAAGTREAVVSADNSGIVIARVDIVPTFSFPATINVTSGFVTAFIAAIVRLAGASFTSPSNVAGRRYLAAEGGIVSSGGGGATFYPGSTAGDASTGTYY
ncbi:hypothetical protein [Chelatococcus reniformis]|uniref:Uncharacterized protein n=1 Tax=Chelatococcus reniformis TaxID=1494448 RepID=A0A916UE81_9HYPH|nr:hypothetical protein [Chelatococcus reniformis]GGC68664.1 hypothetical protein GCM10010994_29060 [Chelatococcus reniformis]